MATKSPASPVTTTSVSIKYPCLQCQRQLFCYNIPIPYSIPELKRLCVTCRSSQSKLLAIQDSSVSVVSPDLVSFFGMPREGTEVESFIPKPKKHKKSKNYKNCSPKSSVFVVVPIDL